jgi:hypothetical protein
MKHTYKRQPSKKAASFCPLLFCTATRLSLYSCCRAPAAGRSALPMVPSGDGPFRKAPPSHFTGALRIRLGRACSISPPETTSRHIIHLCTGFMGAPTGQRNVDAKSAFCEIGPLDRKGDGECRSISTDSRCCFSRSFWHQICAAPHISAAVQVEFSRIWRP